MQILSRYMNRLPTITIRAGHRIRIYFTSDLLVPKETRMTNPTRTNRNTPVSRIRPNPPPTAKKTRAQRP